MEKEIVLTKRLKKALLGQVVSRQDEVLLINSSDTGVTVGFTGKLKHDSDDGATETGWYTIEAGGNHLTFPLSGVVDIDVGAKGKIILMVNLKVAAK